MQILKDEIRDSIYNAALKEFKEKGYEKASMRSIAKKAGVSVGNMYRYFKNKDDLFFAVIGPVYNELIKFISQQKSLEAFDRETENLNIDVQARELVEIYLKYKEELLILIDGSKGSKYEGAKEEIVKLVQNVIINILEVKAKNSNINTEPYFAYVLSKSVIEGVILILKHYEDDEKVRGMVMQFVGFVFKNFDDRI
ncbi:TetR/AcrR family transcriptional regulator [Caloranaerobacter ferrireducens]|uniref:TetR/AcrR family transcriptional regulator n=1 Tax=Caloranaerobacter ferrireducens TaxID=1323370 RepID=UPI00084D55AB|nr:TetR/AcrR family transcriptional regulator [Caloranaerobacter ferrireducens]